MHSNQSDYDRALRASVPFAIAELWDIDCVYERSIKLAQGKLLANRYMIAFEASRLTRIQLADALKKLNIDARAQAEIESNLADTNLILIGFEEEATTANYKVYLELKTKRHPVEGRPQLKHLGYKWQIGCETEFRIAKYLWFPNVCRPIQIQQRTSEMLSHPRTAAAIFIDLVLDGIGDTNRSIAYIESTEEGSLRRAFDLNLYELGLSIDRFTQPIQRMSETYSLNPAELQRWFEVVRGKQLGHVSAGIDRFGKDFVTLYYLAM
jgi:hypothetical protein